MNISNNLVTQKAERQFKGHKFIRDETFKPTLFVILDPENYIMFESHDLITAIRAWDFLKSKLQ